MSSSLEMFVKIEGYNEGEMKQYPKQKEIACIVCGFSIKHLNHEDTHLQPSQMYDGGTVAELYTGYGSCHDGDIYILGVCDECLAIKGIKIGEYM